MVNLFVRQFIFLFLLLICLVWPEAALAHTQPGPPYLLVNGHYADTNPVVTNSITSAQDLAREPILVGTRVTFKIDLTKLNVPPTVANSFRWRWKWGGDDLSYEEGNELIHTFSKTGSYIVTLQVKDPTQKDFFDYDLIQVNVVPSLPYQLPRATVRAELTKTGQASQVDFSTDPTTDAGVSVSKILWDFGDGAAAEGSKVTHSYKPFTGSIYPVVRVIDDNGLFNDTSIQLSDTGNIQAVTPAYPASGSAQKALPSDRWLILIGAMIITLVTGVLLRRRLSRR